MRTRRSPRNQERLWRALGGRTAAPAPTPPLSAAQEVAAHERALAEPFLSPRHRRMIERDLERARLRVRVAKELT